MAKTEIQPRILRMGQAPFYCGMGQKVFDEEIRPLLREIEIGGRGIGFDRLEVDAVLDDYILRRGRAPAQQRSNEQCQSRGMASAFAAGSGISRNELTDGGFEKALERLTG